MKDGESKNEQKGANSNAASSSLGRSSETTQPPNDIFNSALGIFSVPSIGGIFGGQLAESLKQSAKPSKPSRKKKSTRDTDVGEGLNSLDL